MYNKILKLIREAKTIIIHRHSRPDGDALGSQLGLKEAIKNTFPRKNVYAVGDTTNRYSFIGEMDTVEDSEYEDALVFILDTSEQSMISDERYKNGKHLVKIDHHILKEKFAEYELVDSSYESCCGLIMYVIERLRLKLTDYGAKCLYTGMVTDSGRFRYDSTTFKTFDIASKLLKYNFSITEIYNNLYMDTLEMVKLRAKFTLKFKLTDNNVAYIKTTQEEINETGVDIFSISRNMVNTMAGIKGIDIWVNFTEDKDGSVVCEIRSSKYNINPIAVKYGGGGHKAASGATLKNFEEADQLLHDLDEMAKGE